MSRKKLHKFQIKKRRNCAIKSSSEGGAFGDFYGSIKCHQHHKQFLIYSHTFNVTSVSMEQIYISPTASSFQMVVREMKTSGVHGVNLRNAPELVVVVSHRKRENALMRAEDVRVGIKNISLVTYKIAPIKRLTFDNSSAHNLIGRPSRVSTTTGCLIQKHRTHASSIACREVSAFTIDTSPKSSMEHAVMISRWTFALMEHVR